MNYFVSRKSFALLWFFVFASVMAHAVSFRTYVSVAGNDGNTSMSCPANAPCRSFNAALSVTFPHGEVVALDSGDYMPVTVTQSATIKAAPGADATIVSMGFGDAISVNIGSSDTVVVRGLTVNGSNGSGWSGIHFWAGGTLHVENCISTDFSFSAIISDASGKLVITDTIVRNSSFGVVLQSPSGQIHATLDHVQIKNNQYTGLDARNNAQAIIRNSLLVDNPQTAAQASGPSGALTIEDCVIKDNNMGIVAYSPSIIRVSHSTITDNSQGLSPFGGQILSFGNNRLAGNITDGSFTGMVPLQ